MALERGLLVFDKKGRPQIKIRENFFNPSKVDISETLSQSLKALKSVEVEFEWEGGRPKKVREVSGDFVAPRASGVTVKNGAQQGGGGRDNYNQRERMRQDRVQTLSARDFHNPYNFIPAPPRKTDDPELGDHVPVTQERLDPDRITGRIRVEMEAITPLIVPDPSTCQENAAGHKTFNVLRSSDGTPLLPSSSIRGMLRSAYEAVTNSRLGKFSHKEQAQRLAYRMQVQQGIKMIPARIENGQAHLLPGSSSIGGVPFEPQYAAWLPRYSGDKKETRHALPYPDESLPQHGDEVNCWVELRQHYRRTQGGSIPDFKYWKVLVIAKVGDALPAICTAVSGETMKIHGWVCIT